MALTDNFTQIQSDIDLMRLYCRQRYGEASENSDPLTPRWLALLRAIVTAKQQITTLQTNFNDLN